VLIYSVGIEKVTTI